MKKATLTVLSFAVVSMAFARGPWPPKKHNSGRKHENQADNRKQDQEKKQNTDQKGSEPIQSATHHDRKNLGDPDQD